jgi:hypothetical protein
MPGPLKALRVLPRGTAKVPDYAALLGNRVNRFHGWRPETQIGKPFTNPEETKDEFRQGRHLVHVKQLGDVVEIPLDDEHIGSYLRGFRGQARPPGSDSRFELGDVWPADQETATWLGVPFDPDFGGEHGDDAKATLAADIAEIHEVHGATVPLADVLKAHGLSEHAPPDVPTAPATPAAMKASL